MEIQYSEKAKFFKPNIFNVLNERKAKIAQKGVEGVRFICRDT